MTPNKATFKAYTEAYHSPSKDRYEEAVKRFYAANAWVLAT